MNLVKIDNAQLHYGEQAIFDGVSLQVNKGDRLCIVGRNGVGKSTLLKVIEGAADLDDGQVWRSPHCRIASLSQDLPEQSDISVFNFVASGLPELGADLARFAELSNQPGADLDELGRIQQRIELADGWSVQNQVQQTLTRLDLNAEQPLSGLSGGWRRRAALAKALVSKPDVLLLDEPTNHLDIAAIEWLERHLVEFEGAVVFITHDRRFLQQTANSIGELDRGHLSLWQGDYHGFLAFRERQLAEEAKQNAEFDKKLAQEEDWIRQGIKARRTRNEGRVRALKQLRKDYASRRQQIGNAKMSISADVPSGKLVAEFKGVSFGWQDNPVIRDFSGTIVRGDKIGLIGPNGIGKTTFLKLLTGQIVPQSGAVRVGSKLSVAYFDQMRDELDLNRSAADNVSEGRDFIEIGGARKHIIGYLNDFLFAGERARTPIRALSGGERNRVLLAKLFSKPANCLILDEPTNDLDAETLELLEELLIEFEGTVLLVTHDRAFLDNVVTSSIGFEGNGSLKQYVGGFDDWKRQGGVWFDPQAVLQAKESSEKVVDKGAETKVAPPKPPKPKKLSYKLQLELDALPAKIEALENKLEELNAVTSSVGFYSQDAVEVAKVTQALADTDTNLQQAYARWEELEAQASQE